MSLENQSIEGHVPPHACPVHRSSSVMPGWRPSSASDPPGRRARCPPPSPPWEVGLLEVGKKSGTNCTTCIKGHPSIHSIHCKPCSRSDRPSAPPATMMMIMLFIETFRLTQGCTYQGCHRARAVSRTLILRALIVTLMNVYFPFMNRFSRSYAIVLGQTNVPSSFL